MDGVVRAALIANPHATFALRDSGNSSVKPTFFTVKNADAVVASEEVQEIVMEYFDTRVYELSNVTVFNWTQDITHSTRKTMSKQTRLIQRPNGVSTLVRQVSADGLCWFGIAAVQFYKLSVACYPQELCLGSPKYKSGYYGTQLVSATTTFYECEQGKIWDGKSSCVPGASPYTGTDTSAYVDVPGLVSSGDKQKALPCSSMDGVVRAALIANPQATFALRDSGNSSVKPTFFTVKNVDAVVASEEVQEIVMEYFDTRVYELSNVTVFNWTQDITHSTRKTMSKQTRLIQRPNGVSTLVRQVSADGLCWFGIATNSGDAPKTPDEAAKAVAIDAAANATAMLPTGSGTALALADGASPYTGTDTSAYVDVPGLVSSGDKQKALPCSSMDGVVRAALIANPQATFALRDSGNSSVKPTFFTVKNVDAVVASEEVQEIVMEYFDTRVYELSNVTVFNWTQDITHSTRKTMSKQTRLIQRPNGVSTLVRQVSADGLCWFGIATNSSDAPKTPDEAAKAVAIDAAANATAMLPTGSGTALALADGEEYDYTTVLEVGAATAGGLAAVGIVALCVAGSAAPIVGSLVPIAIGTAAALVGMGSVAAVTVVAFAIAAGAIILGAVLVIGVAAAITALIDGACFPAAATAYLALSAGVTGGIGTKRMDQLMLGDSLMTMHALNGSATASPVYLFGHKDAATYGSFVQLQLQSGQTVQLTRAHFLPTFAAAYATASYELPAACNTTTDSCPSSSIDSYRMLSQVGAAYEGMPCVPSGHVAAPAADGDVAASAPAPPSMKMKRAGDVDVDSDLLCAFDNSTGTFACAGLASPPTAATPPRHQMRRQRQ
eukprot:jgi/Sobl393_1/18949/SZX74250.1